MSPKRVVRQSPPPKSLAARTPPTKRDMPSGNAFEESRNSADNWEFHFKEEDVEAIKCIVKTKDIAGYPLIIGAAVLNQRTTLLNLLKHGYNINETDKNNASPLAWSVKMRHPEMIAALLENNADPTIRPQNGDDLACIALGSAQWDEGAFLLLFEWLKKAGPVDVNAFNKHGLSLLHLAVRREWHALIDVLIQNEVNVNIKTAHGVTPLMIASYRNDFAIVARLLGRGASVKRKNVDGFTALCYAFSSAITKELTPPFLVVDKLQMELAKIKIDLPGYLKDRVKLILNAFKHEYADQPSPELMLSHMVIFILKNVENGFELLVEVLVATVIKEALEKFMDDKPNLKLPLAVLNAIFKHTTFTRKVQSLIKSEFIDGGCFALCLKIAHLYEDEQTMLQLAATPIVIASVAYSAAQQWFEVTKGQMQRFLMKYEECVDLIDGTCEQIDFIRERVEDLKYNICNFKRTESPCPTDRDAKSNSKKAKRRAKALKAKIAKIKGSELASRYKSDHPKLAADGRDGRDGGAPPETTSDEEKMCANAISMVMSLLDDDAPETSTRATHNSRKPAKEHSRTINTSTNATATTVVAQRGARARRMPETGDSRPKEVAGHANWQGVIHALPFQASRMYKPACIAEFDATNVATNVDVIIKYLENLLEIIVSRYKDIWHQDKSLILSENEVECVVPSLEHDLEEIQNVEKEQLRVVYREFYNLTRNVKDCFGRDAEACMKILKDLEKFLLTHNIRGEKIIDCVADLEVVAVNATMPEGYAHGLAEYMEAVMAGDLGEDPDVKITFKERLGAKNNAHSMGDYVYLNEAALASCKTADGAPLGQSQPCYMNYLPRYVPNWEEEKEQESEASRERSRDEQAIVPRETFSKWNAVVRSLELMDDGQCFLDGEIRLASIEKRKSHLLSLAGNFSVLEIGLAAGNEPVAVKILSKSDPYALLLKNQLEPLLKLKHKYILSYHTCRYENNLLIIATPLCEYNLGQYVLKMRQAQSPICKVSVIRQLLGGLMFLHNHDEPIVHGNLKPSNVLIDINGVVKVAEFGIYKAKLKTKNLPESTIIWFATELYKMYKSGQILTCTCASDVQVAGMLVHFASNGGTHPFGRNVPDILKHLVDGTAEMAVDDMELYDLLSWMLMGEPCERPSIHQVLSHIFFWSKPKKWSYILLCAGYGLSSTIPIDVERLHASLDKIAEKDEIIGNCWVMTAKKQYPELAGSLDDASDTPSGLLRFIKDVAVNNIALTSAGPINETKEAYFSAFILNSFPHFVLALYRMIEKSEWSDHRVFMRYHNVLDC